MFSLGKKKRIYLDYAAATPVRKEVIERMRPYWDDIFANPSSIHADGVLARTAIEDAREKVARTLKVRIPDVIFTGSGTESNNIAILGTIAQRRKEGVEYGDMEVISTEIEHPSISETLIYVTSLGVQVRYVKIGADGRIDSADLEQLLSTKTVLVTFAYINSEIGVIQNISRLSKTVRAFEKKNDIRIYVHLDAAQAPLWVSCAVDQLGVDVVALDAGKCYGPKGVGILAFRHDVKLSPVLFGGGQESGLRPSTENTALIVGAAEAIVLAQKNFAERAATVQAIRDAGITLFENIEGVELNGSREYRVANNINISISGIDTEFAVISLDEKGIACSTKSACSGATGQGSQVVRAISGDEKAALSTIRFSLGEETTLADITTAATQLELHIQKMRLALGKLTS